MSSRYLMDTNVLFFMQNNFFPKIFISVWDAIDDLIENDKLISIKEVQREIISKKHKKFWDNINSKHNNSFYEDLVNGETDEFKKIEKLDIYTKIIQKKRSNNSIEYWSLQQEWGEYGTTSADPFLICYALCHDSTIVTNESPRSQLNIPHVCKELGVKCIGIEEFFLQNNKKF